MGNGSESEINVAMFASGNGSTVEAILDAHDEGYFDGVVPTLVITNNRHAGVCDRAEKYGVPVVCLPRKGFKDNVKYGEKILEILSHYKVDAFSLNGWMLLMPENVIDEYESGGMNQHPGSLDPGRELHFGGQGMYGQRVHAAHIIYHWLTGELGIIEATTHLVTRKYDEGDLINVVRFPLPNFPEPLTIADFNSPETLELLAEATRQVQGDLLPLEHRNVVDTLKLLEYGQGGVGRFPSYRRRRPLIPGMYAEQLNFAKRKAIELYLRR